MVLLVVIIVIRRINAHHRRLTNKFIAGLITVNRGIWSGERIVKRICLADGVVGM